MDSTPTPPIQATNAASPAQIPQGAGATVPIMPAPTPAAASTPKKLRQLPWIPIALSVMVILSILILWKKAAPATPDAPVAVATPTTFPTPTSVLKLSAIATTSAFLTFSEHVASLSGLVNAFTIQDGSLTPPTLDLEITFTRQ